MRALLLVILIFCHVLSFAQEDERNAIIEKRIEFIGEDLEDSDIDFTTYLEELYFFYDNPINLNQTNFDELSRLNLMTDVQIISILDYQRKFGEILTIYELRAVRELDQDVINRIIPFVTIGEPRKYKTNLKNVLKYGRNDVILRYQRGLQTKEGYIPKSDSILALSPNKQYLGSPDKLYARYKFSYKDKISWGVTAEKDAGEQFFKGAQSKGFDFYSAHLIIKDLGIVKTIVIGDFHANFGQGLTMWSGFNMGKSADVLNVKRYARGLKKYSSVNESNFMRGVGVKLQKNKFDLTVFGSHKKIDANVNSSDTLFNNGEGGITSFQSTGFHRTPGELEDVDAVQQTIIGGATHFTGDNLKIGLVGVSTQYDVPLKESSQTYTQYNFKGTSGFSLGANYLYFKGKTSFFGEFTTSQNLSLVTLNGMTWHVDPRLDIVLLHRYIDKKNQAIYSAPFGGATSNENGLYIGVKAKLTKKFNLSVYYDQFTHSWLKWSTDGPSFGREIFVQADYKINYNSSMYIRLKNKITQRDTKEDVVGIDDQVFVNKTTLRLHYSQRVSKQISLKSRIEVVRFLYDTQKSNGLLLYQDFVYKLKKIPLKLSVRYAIFDTDNYDTRLYAYENDLLYLFSIPSYYGKGIRTYLMAKYDIGKQIDLWVRWGMFSYAHTTEISSGLEKVEGSLKSDIKVQLKIRF
jgi:hypothetical protein